MKQGLIATIFFLVTVAGYGKPMTGAVSSWEGRFALSDDKIVIRTSGKPELRMWLYRLPGGSKGTAVGFSNENGDMILSPTPSEKGVQPVYIRHLVSFAEGGQVELLVLYRVQGNGGLLLVEKYVYDGKHIRLSCKSLYGGRHDPTWQGEEKTEGDRDRDAPRGAPLPHHHSYGSVNGDSADQAGSIQGNCRPSSAK